jgi:hypothetical protein
LTQIGFQAILSRAYTFFVNKLSISGDMEVIFMNTSKNWGFASLFLLFLVAVGCGKPAGAGPMAIPGGDSKNETADPSVPTAKLEGPAAAVAEFLEAVRTGNDAVATKMLSTVTKQKNVSLNRSIAPPASDTAKFTIGKIDYVNQDGARVACTWTDYDSSGQLKTDEAVWLLRRESEGWRVAGLAVRIFPNEDPLLLNFEDPEDMNRRQQWVREEMRRRLNKGGQEEEAKAMPPAAHERPLQAAKPGEIPENPMRR